MRVTRSARPVTGSIAIAVAVVAVLGYLPYLVFSSTTDTLVNAFILLAMASMWNLLAGYAGLVSVGQQAYVGIGAFLVLILAQHGMSPFVAIPFATLGCAVLALPISLVLLRLRGGYFAIATWVAADTCQLIISRFRSLGGGTGATLPGLSGLDPGMLTASTYWAALAVVVAALAGTYLALRSRLGLVLTAIRDDEVAARSAGGRVSRAKRVVFVIAAAGCGAAGAVLIISRLGIDSASAFSIGFSAQMIFVTVIGGIGTIEGPIVGTAIFFILQQTLSRYGAWYLIVLGLAAIVIALWWPRGVWGALSRRIRLHLFPVGYWVQGDEAPRRRGRASRAAGAD